MNFDLNFFDTAGVVSHLSRQRPAACRQDGLRIWRVDMTNADTSQIFLTVDAISLDATIIHLR